ELAIRGVPRVDRSGLALRVHVPAGVAVDELLEAYLALDREAGAAATRIVVSLNARVLPFGGLAAEVGGEDKVLDVRARQVALGELLTRVAHPACAAIRPRLDAARADRFVGGLQQSLGGGLVWVWLVLRHRRPNQ